MIDSAFIRERRKALGLTQAEAAKAAGLAFNVQWSRIERGDVTSVSSDTLIGMALALKCPVAKLLILDPRILKNHMGRPKAKQQKT